MIYGLTPCFEIFDEERNNEDLRIKLDLVDERWAQAFACLATQKKIVERQYNSKVKKRKFNEGSLILGRVFQNTT